MIASDGRLVIRIVKAAVVAVVVLFAVSFFFYAHISAQTQTSDQTTVFRSSARVVLIDVLVTDKDGNPVHGLKPEDFTLTDEGKPRRLSAVEEHQQDSATEQRSAFAPRPNTSTNWVQSPARGAVNIIVFDALNTYAPDRVYARQQLLKLLQNLPSGQQVALFTLGTRLRMIQDFTTSSNVLIAAAKKVSTGSTPLSATSLSELQFGEQGSGSRQGEQQLAEEIEAAANSLGTTRNARDMYVTMMDTRVAYTLDALCDMAKATASLPGRKNVIWLTTGFPLLINGTMLNSGLSKVLRERDYSENIRQTAAALASSQIAIYPIDVRGLIAPNIATDKPPMGPGAGAPGWERQGAFEGFDERDTMKTMAEETGGRAYYDKNDLDFGIREVLTKQSNYYTLAYSPRDVKWDGSYHNVSVKLARKGVELTYRRGYHAVGEKPLTDEQASRSMGDALGLDTLDSRIIVLAAQVSQPQAPGQPIKIQCFIDPNTLVLDDNPDASKSAAVAIGATAWDAEKHKAAYVATKVQPVLKHDQMAKFQTAGIPWTLEMAVQPGSYTLKLAVVDLKSGKTGSLSVPLKVEVSQQRTLRN